MEQTTQTPEQTPQRRSKSNAAMYGQKTFVPATESFAAVSIPSVVHEAFSGITAYKDPAQAPAGIADAAEFMKSARAALENVNAYRVTPDPTATEAAHVLAINELAERTMQTIGRQFDRAKSALLRAEEFYKGQIAEQSRLIQTGNAAEIRAVIRGLPKEERYSVILEAIEKGDNETLGAALNGHHVTVGLTADQQENLRTLYQRKKAGAAFEALEAVRKSQIGLFGAFDAVLSVGDEIGLAGRAAKLKEAKKAAMLAQQTARIEASI